MTQPIHTELASPRVRTLAPADLVALAKPRITLMVAITAYGGLWLAQKNVATPLAWSATLAAIVGICSIVAGANALNMYIEREIDRRMDRTKNRPLPAGRLSPQTALTFGVVTSIVAMPILAFGVNLLTAFLAALAHILYVFAYTPMKQRSHYALHIGAIPGAIPPLLGWTAVTGRVDWPGVALFAILFFWQLPHFLAISLFRRKEYARAGLIVMPNAAGEQSTKEAIVLYSFGLIASSLSLGPLGVEHRGYLISAGILGAIFFAWASWGMRRDPGRRWAPSLFGISILYLLLLFVAVVAHA